MSNRYIYAARGMTYARFFPSDWRTGCLTLNLEEEGLYIRFCMYMYDTAQAVPDDYAEGSRLLRVHYHKYRKVLDSLIAKGKIIRAQGLLINERVQQEFDRWKAEQGARIMAAKKREADRRIAALREMDAQIGAAKQAAARGTTPQTTPQTTPPVYPGVDSGLPTQSNVKNPNGINGSAPEPWHSCGTDQNPESRIHTHTRVREGVAINGVSITGPGFELDLGAIDLQGSLYGVDKERARKIAEVCARDWARTGKVPQYPMSVVQSKMRKERNESQIQDVRMSTASGSVPARGKSRRAELDKL